jgi:threonine dehydrogenase-like Zn-dependent dehydrogenase
MRGVMFTGNRTVEMREFPDPHAGPGEAVLKVRASGLCGTDLHRYRGPDPVDAITGHEPCGVIAELGAGAAPGLAVGDRVICHHYAGCGVCEMCTMGNEQLCPHGKVTYGGVEAHGANADYILVPSRTLVHLPDELSFEVGAAISCGTGTACNGLMKLNVSGRDMVAIFGQGPVGLSGTMTAKAMGARVIGVDIVPERLELARQYGADHVINSRETDPVQAIRELTGGLGASAALETSGNPEARSQLLQALRPMGRCCYVGMGGPSTIEFRRDVIFKSATIYGSWTFSKSELIAICRFMIEAKVPADDLITHRFKLHEYAEAFRLFDGATTGKCVFVMD